MLKSNHVLSQTLNLYNTVCQLSVNKTGLRRQRLSDSHGTIANSLVKVLDIQLCLTATAWAVVYQAPLSMGFSRQEY